MSIKKYIVNAVKFFYEEKFFLFILLFFLVAFYESYYVIGLTKIPNTFYENFFETPFGRYILVSSFSSYIIIQTSFLFFFCRAILFYLLTCEYFKMSIDHQDRKETYFFYARNFDCFWQQGILPKCGSCSTPLNKLPYVKNFGYCDECRKAQDEKQSKNKQKYLDNLKFLKENGLI